MKFSADVRSYRYEEFDGCWVAVFETGSLRPGPLFVFEETFPGERRFKGKLLRGSFASAGPIISTYASHTREGMFYSLLAPQMTTEAEVLLLDAVGSPQEVRKSIWHKCLRRTCMFAQQARSITLEEIARALAVGVHPPFETAQILPLNCL